MVRFLNSNVSYNITTWELNKLGSKRGYAQGHGDNKRKMSPIVENIKQKQKLILQQFERSECKYFCHCTMTQCKNILSQIWELRNCHIRTEISHWIIKLA